MPVYVPPGNFREGMILTESLRTEPKVPWYNEYTYNHTGSALVRAGFKSGGTSPVIVIKDQRWSLNHGYIRSAGEVRWTGSGHVKRGRWYYYGGPNPAWKGQKTYLTVELSGTLPPVNSDYLHSYWINRSPFADAWGTPGMMPANLQNRLTTELLNKIGRRQWSAGESLAESTKTLAHLARTVRTVLDALTALKRGRFWEIPKILRVKPKDVKSGLSLSERWLEYQYGWMPLLLDIYDAHQVFKNGLKRPQIIRGSRRIRYDTWDKNRDSQLPGLRLEGLSVQSGQAIAYYRMDDEALNYLQQLGLLNPVEILWAVQPYSFVLDWLIPVQNTLQAATDTVGMTFIDGSFCHRVETVTKIFLDDYSWLSPCRIADGGELLSSSQFGTFRAFGMRRSVMSKPTPKFYYKNPFSSTHVVSALALLRQLRR